MAGALRQFVLQTPKVGWTLQQVKSLDDVVLSRPQAWQDAYREGINSARALREQLSAELESTTDVAMKRRLETELGRSSTYSALNIEKAIEYLRHHLEDR